MNIVVVGAGFVGTATGTVLKEHGNRVSYVDIDTKRIIQLTRDHEVAHTPDEFAIGDTDVVFVSVPTPSEPEGGIVLTQVEQAATSIGWTLKRDFAEGSVTKRPIIVFRSTMLPGTTRRLKSIIERLVGQYDHKYFGIAYMPEYLRERHAVSDFRQPRLILIGTEDTDRETRKVLSDLFCDFRCPQRFTSYELAEYQKYVHNCYNAVKISFFNEWRLVAERFGLDATHLDEIFGYAVLTAEAQWNSVYGTVDRGAFGGTCLPKDVQAMLDALRQLGFSPPILAGAEEVNRLVQAADLERKQALNDSLPSIPIAREG